MLCPLNFVNGGVSRRWNWQRHNLQGWRMEKPNVILGILRYAGYHSVRLFVGYHIAVNQDGSYYIDEIRAKQTVPQLVIYLGGSIFPFNYL